MVTSAIIINKNNFRIISFENGKNSEVIDLLVHCQHVIDIHLKMSTKKKLSNWLH